MKRLIPLMLVLFASNGLAEDRYGKFYGQFTCTVDSSQLTVSEEGELRRSGGYHDSFGFQDKVKITYYVTNNQYSKGQLYLLIDNEAEGKQDKGFGSGEDKKTGGRYPGDRISMGNKEFSIFWGISLGHNNLRANNGHTLNMYRYFKNDWAAVLNVQSFWPDLKKQDIETVTFSCYHSRDRVDEVADELERLW